MTHVAGGETGDGDLPKPAKGLDPLKPEVFKNRPRRLALVEQLRILVGGTGRTSKSLAAQINVSPSSLSKLLSGGRLPPRAEIEQLLGACHVTDEVRSQLLRMHTAALGEAHPIFADRLMLADDYDDSALRQQQLESRLRVLSTQQHQRRLAYEELQTKYEATSQALDAAQARIRTQQTEFDDASARAADLLTAEQEAHRADEEELRRLRDRTRQTQETLNGLRTRTQQQESELRRLRNELSQGAEELHAVRADRDQARCETAQLREELVTLQWELAAAERDQGHHHDEPSLTLRMVEEVLDQWSQTIADGVSSASDAEHAPDPTTAAAGTEGRSGAVSGPETRPAEAFETATSSHNTASLTSPRSAAGRRWRVVAIAALWSVLVPAIGAGTWALASLFPSDPAWTVPVKTTMVAGPVATHGTVFAGGANGTVYALNAATGHTQWTHPTQLLPHSLLAADHNSVFVSSQDGRLSALNAATGHPRWSSLLQPVSGPVTAKGLVFAADHSGHIRALDAATGRPRWSALADKDGLSAGPVTSQGLVIAVGRNGRLYAFNATTGHRAWVARVVPAAHNEIAVASSRVFLSGTDGLVHAVDLPTGHIRWAVHTGPAHLTVDDFYVYACTTSGKAVVYALEAGTGQQRWRHTTSRHATDTAIAVTGDVLYTAINGEVDVLYAPTGESGWGPDLPDPPKNNHHVSMAPIGGTLYLNTAHSVRAINMGTDPFPAAVHGYGAAGQ